MTPNVVEREGRPFRPRPRMGVVGAQTGTEGSAATGLKKTREACLNVRREIIRWERMKWKMERREK